MKATPGWSSDIFLIKTSHRSSSLSEWFWYPTLPVSVLSCSISWYYIISCSLCQSYYFQQPRQTHEWINFEHFWNYRYFYNDFMIIFFINQYWSSEKRLLNVIINKLFIHAFVLGNGGASALLFFLQIYRLYYRNMVLFTRIFLNLYNKVGRNGWDSVAVGIVRKI